MNGKTILVAGASGFVGSAAIERFSALGFPVIGLSRRLPSSDAPGARFLPVDLRDRQSVLAVAGQFSQVTHLVYAAINETPGDLIAAWTDPDHAARNGAMLANLLAVLEAHAPQLEQVILMHGTKAYATHRSDVHAPVPLHEDLPRPDNDDFYFRQEDMVRDLAKRRGVCWTVFRAPMITGGGRGSNLNALLAVSVFAALRKDAGLALPFPGLGDRHDGVMEMVDVELLARGIAWATEVPAARNQIFNIANGDVYVWPDLWPVIAEEMGMDAGPPQPFSVRAYIDSEAPRWTAIVRRHGLSAPEDVAALLGESGSLADFALGNCGRSILTSTIKLRQAGFADCVDTSESVVRWIRRWRAEGLIPPQ
jgi:nucleoside-diphosphate-sugar epimerase